MGQEHKDIKAQAEQPVPGARQEWRRPKFKKTDAREAESHINPGVDVIFS